MSELKENLARLLREERIELNEEGRTDASENERHVIRLDSEGIKNVVSDEDIFAKALAQIDQGENLSSKFDDFDPALVPAKNRHDGKTKKDSTKKENSESELSLNDKTLFFDAFEKV